MLIAQHSTELTNSGSSIDTCWKEGKAGGRGKENIYHWGEVYKDSQRGICFPFIGVTGSLLLEKISRNICES